MVEYNRDKENKMAASEKFSILVSVFAGCLVAVGLFFEVVLLGNSWIKWVLIGLTVVFAAVWLVAHGRLKRVIRFVLIGLMVFVVCFALVESYVLQNPGFAPQFEPITEGALLSQSNVLNVSVMQILDSVKNCVGFGFISFEHPGEISFESLSLDTTYPGGRIDVSMYQRSSSLGFHFAADNGNKYRVRVLDWKNLPLSQTFAQNQPAEHALKQIDALGLDWFYIAAVDGYVNQTGTSPAVDALQISIRWEEYENYQGLTLLIMGIKIEDAHGHGVFYVDFQPDGTLLYLNIAND